MADITREAIQEIANMGVPAVVVSTLPGGQPAVVVRDGFRVCVLPTDQALADRPRRIKGTAKVYESESFCKYFTDFRDQDSRIFADDAAGTVLAVLDYHQDNKEDLESGEEIEPRWGEHRLQLSLRKSEEWQLWTGQNAKRMSQEDFARFIEDNAPDIVSPEPASMLEIARSMTAKLEINVDSAVRTNAGATFRYNEVVKAGGLGPAGQFSIPDEFLVCIPVYLGQSPITIKARLRYQLSSAKLQMWYDLFRWQECERKAFRYVRDTIQSETGVVILSGSPA